VHGGSSAPAPDATLPGMAEASTVLALCSRSGRQAHHGVLECGPQAPQRKRPSRADADRTSASRHNPPGTPRETAKAEADQQGRFAHVQPGAKRGRHLEAPLALREDDVERLDVAVHNAGRVQRLRVGRGEVNTLARPLKLSRFLTR